MVWFLVHSITDQKLSATKELRDLMHSTSLPAIAGHHHHQYHTRNVNQRRGNHHHNQTFAVGALNLGQLSIGLGLGFR